MCRYGLNVATMYYIIDRDILINFVIQVLLAYRWINSLTIVQRKFKSYMSIQMIVIHETIRIIRSQNRRNNQWRPLLRYATSKFKICNCRNEERDPNWPQGTSYAWSQSGWLCIETAMQYKSEQREREERGNLPTVLLG